MGVVNGQKSVFVVGRVDGDSGFAVRELKGEDLCFRGYSCDGFEFGF
jgi:hypothetical protein